MYENSGRSCFLLKNTGTKALESKNNLLTTIGWNVNGERNYCLEGSVFIAGAAVQWVRDGLKFIDEAAEIEELANHVKDNGGVYMVPAFAGLGAPHWDQYARGIIVGITRGTSQAHIARATLESIAFQVSDVVQAMKSDSGIGLTALRVDGGACKNNFLMQFQADILDCVVERPTCLELTALGAAYLAGLAVGFWKSTDELEQVWKVDRIFEPKMDATTRNDLLEHWHKAVSRSQGWAKE